MASWRVTEARRTRAVCDGDRVAFFHLQAMWPFQYRLGAAAIPEMADAMQAREDHGLHHTYKA
ncbi:MAG: hypothetical protein NT047_08765 [Deltaproteobacteria bacterium]|nr:hypothetical protein [Deltaproteobacteria bacterium]